MMAVWLPFLVHDGVCVVPAAPHAGRAPSGGIVFVQLISALPSGATAPVASTQSLDNLLLCTHMSQPIGYTVATLVKVHA